MQVHFQKNWFGPDLVLYRKCESKVETREVPDKFKPLLPSTARIVKGSVGRVEPEVQFEEDEIDTLKSALEIQDKVVQAAEDRHDAQVQKALERTEAIREQRRANLAKARAARQAKMAAEKGN